MFSFSSFDTDPESGSGLCSMELKNEHKECQGKQSKQVLFKKVIEEDLKESVGGGATCLSYTLRTSFFHESLSPLPSPHLCPGTLVRVL